MGEGDKRMTTGRGRYACVLVAAALLTDCSSTNDPVGPGDPPPAGILTLQSVGQTIRAYEAGEMIVPAGTAIDLGGLFDGNAMDLLDGLAVTTESTFGGDRVLAINLADGTVVPIGFEVGNVNPSKPHAVESRSSAFVGGRGTNSLYEIPLAAPGTAPIVFASDVGEFVEKVVVTNGRVFAVDSNIDDAGGSFEPLGNSRIAVYGLDGTLVRVVDALGLQASDAVLSAGQIVVLNAGSLSPTFEPEGNGSLAVVDPATLAVAGPFALGGNGVSLEDGADGLVYVTATSDFNEIRLLRFDASSNAFINGPTDPIDTRDAAGAGVACWVATALSDGRLVCATFSFAQAGQLYLMAADGGFLSASTGGFGTTDLEIVTSQP